MNKHSEEDYLSYTKEKLKHIQAPMRFDEIVKQFAEDAYNAELLLQHALLCLLRQSFRVQ